MTLSYYRRIQAMRRQTPAETQAALDQARWRSRRQRAYFALLFRAPTPPAGILYDDG